MFFNTMKNTVQNKLIGRLNILKTKGTILGHIGHLYNCSYSILDELYFLILISGSQDSSKNVEIYWYHLRGVHIKGSRE